MESWNQIAQIAADWPLWAKLLLAAVLGYFAIRVTVKQVLSPLAEEARQFLFAIRKAIDGIFRKKSAENEKDLPTPPRKIPQEVTIWESAEIPAGDRTRPNMNGIPIITVANMKGGVGKTTIVANLAQEFAEHLQKPTLVIDFDYQGSLSQCIRGEAGLTEQDVTSDVLIGTTDEDPIIFARQMRRKIENIWIYPASYPLATIENNILAEWSQSKNYRNMYFLAKQLKRQDFQKKFGCVIIDCPPRLTPGSINALCASTHLLVPTTLDDMSAQAAEYFLTQIGRLQEKEVINLRVLGIVPSIVASKLQVHETSTLGRLKAFGREKWNSDNFVLEGGRIVRAAAIARSAGVGVAYVSSAAARDAFAQLGAAIRARL